MPEKREIDLIFDTLSTKSDLKQRIFRNTRKHFEQLRTILAQISEEMSARLAEVSPDVEVSYTEINDFESQLKFSGDVLVFTMHSNVFGFPGDHVIFKNPYIATDNDRSFCGMIQIYNFLSDSFKYNRFNDVGYLIGRIFINHEDHFFVDGNKRLIFLYSDISKQIISEDIMREIVEHAIKFALDFDLYVPPFDTVREIAVGEKLMQQNFQGMRTGKRLGFDLSVYELKDGDEAEPTGETDIESESE